MQNPNTNLVVAQENQSLRTQRTVLASVAVVSIACLFSSTATDYVQGLFSSDDEEETTTDTTTE